MKIPKKLKIGAHIFTVEYKELDEKLGELDRENNTLRLHDRLPENQLMVTLIHEAFHAMNSELNHVVLDSLAEQMYAFLKENDFLK